MGRKVEGRLDERDIKHTLGRRKCIQNVIWKPVEETISEN